MLCVSFNSVLLCISVCLSFMERFIASLDKDVQGSPPKIETAFRKMCKDAKKDDNRFVSIFFLLYEMLPMYIHCVKLVHCFVCTSTGGKSKSCELFLFIDSHIRSIC